MSTKHVKSGDKVVIQLHNKRLEVTYVADDIAHNCTIVRLPSGALLAWNFQYMEPAFESVRVSGWVNVYGDSISALYESKEQADKFANMDRIACVYVSGVEGEEPK